MDLELLAKRIDCLERKNRRLKYLGGLFILTMGTGLIMGQGVPTNNPSTDYLKARAFAVVDEHGTVRATLAYNKKLDSTALVIDDGKGLSIRLAMRDDIAGLVLTGKDGSLNVQTSDTFTGFTLSDSSGYPRSLFSIDDTQGGSWALRDKNGEIVYLQTEQLGVDQRKIK